MSARPRISPFALALLVSLVAHFALLAGLPNLWAYSKHAARAPFAARLEPAPAQHETSDRAEPPAIVDQPQPPSRRDTVRRVMPKAATPRAPSAAPTVESNDVSRAGDDAIDAGTLAQYQLALRIAGRRHLVYPRDAIERGAQGRAVVRLAVARDGSLRDASVRQSSGHTELDRQAVETLRRAHAQTPLPPALRERAFDVDVTVMFEL